MSAEKKLTLSGFQAAATWLCDTIKQLFATQTANLVAQVYAVSGMAYLFHEDNVQAISQYGQEGRTYYFGDSSTEGEQAGVPAMALYYTETDGERSIKVFVTAEGGEYIVTQPNDKGDMFTCEYHNDITYLG